MARWPHPAGAGPPAAAGRSGQMELMDRRPEMNIDKDQILQLLRSQGKDDQASQASSELPDKVDTDNAQHAGILSKYGIDPGNIGDKLGGLGKLL
jgi:hypothetical protein